MTRSTDDILAAVQAKRKAESSFVTGADIGADGRIYFFVNDQAVGVMPFVKTSQQADTTPAPLPTDEQIASLLKENERLSLDNVKMSLCVAELERALGAEAETCDRLKKIEAAAKALMEFNSTADWSGCSERVWDARFVLHRALAQS